MGGVYTKVLDIASLRPGDHIAIWDVSRWPISYQHHGIVWASGETASDIKVCHVWSPLEGYREAQADSCFRISTLEEFLFNRTPSHLRLVEYHTSGLRELLSRWGEVHLTKSDLPEVVLARCKYLLGLGRGDFNIFRQNCEHAAHWCMTGEQWCKQNLTRAKGRVPFENRVPKEDVDALYQEIEDIKALSRSVVDSVLALSGKRVYIRVNGSHYVTIRETGQVAVTPQGDNPATCGRVAFRLECYSKVYNCIKKAAWLRGKTGLKWEYSTLGYMKSMNQHRRYVGIRDDGILIDVSMRGQACRFEFVDCDADDEGNYEPPDINVVTRAFNHEKSITHMQSRSMRDFEETLKQAHVASQQLSRPTAVV